MILLLLLAMVDLDKHIIVLNETASCKWFPETSDWLGLIVEEEFL